MKEKDKEKKLDSAKIKLILPHRYPFLLIDRVLDYQPGEYAIAQKNISVNEGYFQGHFPENPIMPGVLILESLAQTSAITLLTLPKFKGKIAYFGGIKKARFRKPVTPGNTLWLEAKINKLYDNEGFVEAQATVQETIVCTASLIFSIK